MPSRFFHRLWILWVAVFAFACEPDTPRPQPDRVYELPGTGLWLLTRGEGVTALDPHGRKAWSFERTFPPQPEYGLYPRPYLACPPKLAPNGSLILPYSDRIFILDASTGERAWTWRMPLAHLCPVITPDSGMVVAIPARHGSGRLVKHRADGTRAFMSDLPDVGKVQSLAVDTKTGDVIVRGATHVLSVSPAGAINWVKPLSDYGAGE